MAKGNMLLGYARGSVGDITFSRNQGRQVVKARNRQPKNPKSEAQRVQRAIFATVSAALASMREIVDHSFEGVEYGQLSTQYFSARNIALLKQRVQAGYTAGTQATVGNFNFKGFASAQVNPYQISKGSLTSPIYERTAETIHFTTNLGNVVVNDEAAYNNLLASLGIVPGDQLTFCFLDTVDGGDEASFGNSVNVQTVFNYFRVVFAPWDAAKMAGQQLVNLTTSTFNPLFLGLEPTAIEAVNGALTVDFDTDGLDVSMTDQDTTSTVAVAVIRSQRQDDGSFKRSTEYLLTPNALTSSIADAEQTYGEGVSVLGSEYYLNGSETTARKRQNARGYAPQIVGLTVSAGDVGTYTQSEVLISLPASFEDAGLEGTVALANNSTSAPVVSDSTIDSLTVQLNGSYIAFGMANPTTAGTYTAKITAGGVAFTLVVVKN